MMYAVLTLHYTAYQAFIGSCSSIACYMNIWWIWQRGF